MNFGLQNDTKIHESNVAACTCHKTKKSKLKTKSLNAH